ncbi:MAG: hypothetical protein Q8O15_06615 [Rectinemataceae bacterium]|nr:hypothetical protein [Rectinemataceae bacterium]
MLAKDYLKWYARSPLGIGSIFSGIIAAIAMAAAGLTAGLGFLAGSAIVVVVGLVAVVSGWGPKSAIAALDAAEARERDGKLKATGEAREKLARLRLGEGEAAAALSLVVLAAGEYLEACRREGRQDPLAAAALEESLDIANIFLKEKDEAATEKRFGLDDKDPFADAEMRVAEALREKAALLRERRVQIDGGLSAEGRMSVMEEIE